MTIEDFLKNVCGVNPSEKIDTNNDSFWKLADLVKSYIDEEELTKPETRGIPSFNEWLLKYFEEPEIEIMYKGKLDKKKYSKSELREKFDKAFTPFID